MRLRQRIRTWIEEWQVADGLGAWPQELMKERGLFLLHGNQAFLWYLASDGAVYSLDRDRAALEMEPETDPDAAMNAVAQGARQYPELSEMLPQRPPSARDCGFCGGSGDEDRWGRCVCAGLGWLPV